MGCITSKIQPIRVDIETQTEGTLIDSSIYNVLSPSHSQYTTSPAWQNIDTIYSNAKTLSITPSLNNVLINQNEQTGKTDINIVIHRLEAIKEHTNSITQSNSI